MTYRLLWQDLFDKDQLNQDIWSVETGGTGFGNKEDQFYTNQSKNLMIKDQTLHIVAHKEAYEHKSYTSAKISTKHKKTIKYGRVDVLASIPKGRGTWPAIWLLGENIQEVGWPMCGEIDLMEHVGKNPGYFHFSLHSKAYNHKYFNHPTYVHEDMSLLDTFHLYRMDWDEDQISFYVDNQLMATFKKEEQANKEQWPFDQPFYLVLNLAIGGTWGGTIDDQMFPVSFKIKHVKVYERSE